LRFCVEVRNAPQVVVAHHGHCFDGACSAALFTRYLREREGCARFTYRALAYEPVAVALGDKLVDGAINAVLDFRYTMSPKLTWYFDHHVSAFQEPGSREHFERDASRTKFHDGQYGSCTKLIADVLRARVGWEAPDLEPMIHWADVIDAARFESAEAATSLDEPALAITAVVQELGDDSFCAELIPKLATEPLSSIAKSPLIEGRLRSIRDRIAALTARMERVGEQKGLVAYFDLSDQPLETVAKFVGYRLFPTAMYTVVLAWSPRRAKISVGFNPWCKKARRHDIAALCEQYGGGGHPVVGAISLSASDLPRARAVFAALIEQLNA
jgi:hypothetical protein